MDESELQGVISLHVRLVKALNWEKTRFKHWKRLQETRNLREIEEIARKTYRVKEEIDAIKAQLRLFKSEAIYWEDRLECKMGLLDREKTEIGEINERIELAECAKRRNKSEFEQKIADLNRLIALNASKIASNRQISELEHQNRLISTLSDEISGLKILISAEESSQNPRIIREKWSEVSDFGAFYLEKADEYLEKASEMVRNSGILRLLLVVYVLGVHVGLVLSVLF